MLLVIDNYDSFTYNLVQYSANSAKWWKFAATIELLDEIEQLRPERIVISPGPGTPDDAGISLE